jgi:prepilin-type N-terminal cleavage/methylation domain-containing protein
MTDKCIKRTEGFTLVELSIVIIIIGFLIAGVSSGQSLIKQAALSSVITDMQSYAVAYTTFLDRYQGAPGDITNGGVYFPTCSDSPGNSVTYCSGDGNGKIDETETYAAWRQLELAGMIHAGINTVPALVWDQNQLETIGTTVPASKISGAGYKMLGGYYNVGYNAGTSFASPTVNIDLNFVYLGKVSTGFGLGSGALTPQDAFNLDKKIDDGTINSSNEFIGANTGNFNSTRASGNDIPTCVTFNYGNIYDIVETSATCVSGLALN